MANWRIERLKNFLIKKLEDILFSGKTSGANNDILLLKLDKLGDYILFRNFIEEIYKVHHASGKIILCGNIAWKELAEKLDSEFISEFIWVDINKLENYSYRFSILRKIRQIKCNKLIHCSYSRNAQGDNIAVHSGAKEIVGYRGDTTNMTTEQKKEYDSKYTVLLPSEQECMFEFYRNKLFFESLLETKISLTEPIIKLKRLAPDMKNQIIIIFPGAGHLTRRWLTSNFATLSNSLFQIYKLPIYVCGAENEKPIAKEIIALTGNYVTDYTGNNSLYETLEIIQKAAIIVTNDSGPLHLAMSLRTPTVCISNGNHFERFCPYPREMKMPLTVVYPDEFEVKMKDNKSADLIRCKNSDLDINTIKPEKVLLALQSNPIMKHA
jgi:ADP-heptose:LPS heptosyltransferase